MTRSSLTEETPATPGWVDDRVAALFAPLGDAAKPVGDAYADCLAGVRGAVDTDSGHDRCRREALAAVRDVPGVKLDGLDKALQALEAEISNGT